MSLGIQAHQAFQRTNFERVVTSVAALLNVDPTVKKEKLALEPFVKTALCRNREPAFAFSRQHSGTGRAIE
jgi:hypothetical protein